MTSVKSSAITATITGLLKHSQATTNFSDGVKAFFTSVKWGNNLTDDELTYCNQIICKSKSSVTPVCEHNKFIIYLSKVTDRAFKDGLFQQQWMPGVLLTIIMLFYKSRSFYMLRSIVSYETTELYYRNLADVYNSVLPSFSRHSPCWFFEASLTSCFALKQAELLLSLNKQ